MPDKLKKKRHTKLNLPCTMQATFKNAQSAVITVTAPQCSEIKNSIRK